MVCRRDDLTPSGGLFRWREIDLCKSFKMSDLQRGGDEARTRDICLGKERLTLVDPVFHWLIVSIETTYRSDHGGFHSIVVICNLKVEFNFYDIRHWNDEAGRYNLESEYDATR
jgi:hypothetical protein